MPLDTPDFEAELERAIAMYADPSDAGHPQVLMAHIMAAVEARRWKRRWWLGIAVAVPMLSCLLIAILYIEQSETRPHAANSASLAPIYSPVIAPRTLPSPRLEVARHETARHIPRQLPKLDQFPSPSAPTEQEQQLMQFIAHASPYTQQLVAKARMQPDKALHIAELSIPYLDSGTKPQ